MIGILNNGPDRRCTSRTTSGSIPRYQAVSQPVSLRLEEKKERDRDCSNLGCTGCSAKHNRPATLTLYSLDATGLFWKSFASGRFCLWIYVPGTVAACHSLTQRWLAVSHCLHAFVLFGAKIGYHSSSVRAFDVSPIRILCMWSSSILAALEVRKKKWYSANQ